MTHTNPPAAALTGSALDADRRARFTPSPAQDAAAAESLRNHPGDPDGGRATVFTTQLLIGKRRHLWTADVRVAALPGVHWSRDEALAACVAAAAVYRMSHPDVPVSASYCRHEAPPAGEVHRTRDGRTWATAWDVHNDIVAETAPAAVVADHRPA